MVKAFLNKLSPHLKQKIEQKLALYTPIDKNGGLPHALLRSPSAQLVEFFIQRQGARIATAATKYELPPTLANTFKDIMSELTRARFINTNENIKCLTEPLLTLTRRALQSTSVLPCRALLAMLPDQAVWVKKDGAVVALFGHSRNATQMAVGMRVTVEACDNGFVVTKLQLEQKVSTAQESLDCAQKALGATGPPGPPEAPNGLPDAGPAVLAPPKLRRQNAFVRPLPPVRRPTQSTRLPANVNVENAAQLLMQLSVGTQWALRL
jgi:hypothetical protein